MAKPAASELAINKLSANPRFKEAPKTGSGFFIGAAGSRDDRKGECQGAQVKKQGQALDRPNFRALD